MFAQSEIEQLAAKALEIIKKAGKPCTAYFIHRQLQNTHYSRVREALAYLVGQGKLKVVLSAANIRFYSLPEWEKEA